MTATDRDGWRGVEWNHRRIDRDEWDDIYVVGDVHGCYDALSRLVDRIDPSDRDLLIFVGDLVRKGPESAAVLEFVRERSNAISVRGNNETKLLRGDASIPDLGAPEYEQLASMPVAIGWEEALVVHGGVDPDRHPTDQTATELQTMRSIGDGEGYEGPFWFDAYEGPPRVFFGHTVLERPVETGWAIGLDTGCVYGGALTAYDVARDRFVSVESDEHRPRPPEKFLRPESA